MTDKQSAIFRRVLDTNWEIKEIQESGNWDELKDKVQEYQAALKEFKIAMGKQAFEEFMENGRRMFF